MSNKEYPKIHLAVDNCFAVKRWVRPRDWMNAIKEIGGISLIQASTDNEIDPAHNTQDFRDEWIEEVQHYENQYGFKVVSFLFRLCPVSNRWYCQPFKKQARCNDRVVF